MKKKILPNEKSYLFDSYDVFDGKEIDGVIDRLEDLKKELNLSGVSHRLSSDYDGGLWIQTYREETDAEYEKRTLREEKRKEKKKANDILHKKARDEADKKVYLKLKAKFEKEDVQ